MTTNTINQVSYLRTTRNFPTEINQLSVEIDRTYVDIANAVNCRTIGIFTTNFPALTGETWYLRGSTRQQSLRKVFTFTASSTFPIPHNINFNGVERFTRMWGTYTNAAGNWYGIIAGSNVAIGGQLSFYVTPTNIVFVTGSGAPTLVSGQVILEWLSQP